MSWKTFLRTSIVAAGLALAGPVSAQTGGTTGTTATPLDASDFTTYYERYDAGSESWVRMNQTEQQYFFNRARCECAGDLSGTFRIVIYGGAQTGNKIRTLMTAAGTATATFRLYAGTGTINCLAPSSVVGGDLSGSCTNLLNPDEFNTDEDLTVFSRSNNWTSKPIPVAWLYNSLDTPTCGASQTCNDIADCTNSSRTSQTIQFWVKTNSGQAPDTQNLSLPQIKLRGSAVFKPVDVTAGGGNDAIEVQWGWGTQSVATDPAFLGVQIFCRRAADLQVFPSNAFSPSYQRAQDLCGDTAPATGAYGAFEDLDERFLCSGVLPPTSTSHRIENLQNEMWYAVGVAAVDRYGNVGAIDETELVYAQPIPTVDFYSKYRSEGGSARGGYCAVAGGLGGATSRMASAAVPLGLVALGITLGVLAARRRSRRKRGAALIIPLALAAGASLLSAQAAQAQAISHEEGFGEHAEPAWKGTPQRYAIELRFGMYSPNIDSEFDDGAQGPNAFIFGTSRRAMWQLEFDWQILRGFGSLGVGGSVGYFKQNAKACELATLQASVGAECKRTRDNTSLRLIPFAVLLVYRMDEAANRWRIPLVPYAKAGLNYTIWTVTNGDGEVATFPAGGRGQGGTAGWQATLGLALQLDFLDRGAARGFDADVGVNHTYIFFEMTHIDASGLYRDDALRVGDDTWFAGLTFEF